MEIYTPKSKPIFSTIDAIIPEIRMSYLSFVIAWAQVQIHTPSMACDKVADNGLPTTQQI